MNNPQRAEVVEAFAKLCGNAQGERVVEFLREGYESTKESLISCSPADAPAIQGEARILRQILILTGVLSSAPQGQNQ